MVLVCRCQIVHGGATPFRTGFVLYLVASDSRGAMMTRALSCPTLQFTSVGRVWRG